MRSKASYHLDLTPLCGVSTARFPLPTAGDSILYHIAGAMSRPETLETLGSLAAKSER